MRFFATVVLILATTVSLASSVRIVNNRKKHVLYPSRHIRSRNIAANARVPTSGSREVRIPKDLGQIVTEDASKEVIQREVLGRRRAVPWRQ